MRITARLKKYFPWTLGGVFFVLLALGASSGSAPQEQIACDQGALTLDSPLLPSPPAATDNTTCSWDIFAWNSFAALNWPADTTQRGFPDPDRSKTFKNTAGTNVERVWETFKEKREVFQATPNPVWNVQEIQFPKPADLWDQFDGYCTAEEEQQGDKPERGFVFLNKFHDQLDETAEVASEALEPNSVLCQGHSPDCSVHGKPVGPRVWKGDPTQPGSKPVYYEVKVNYDFFDYVISDATFNPPLFNDNAAVTNALQGRIQLPMRAAYTKSTGGPSANPDAIYSYPDGCDPYTGSGPEIPCRVGSIHMKSGWIQFEEGEDTSDYHTADAIFYKQAPGQPDKICMSIGTFGLVGLHAIQRVHLPYPSGSTPPTLGGTFIFATWEHKEIIKANGSSDYRYVNYLLDGSSNQLVPFPALKYAIPVSRMLVNDPSQPVKPPGCTLSQGQTCLVNDMAAQQLTGTVWENYQLIGTQFAAVGSKSDSDKLAQPYYLANLVIETNQGLQQFQGIPPQQPRLQPPQWCAKDTNGNCLENAMRLVPGNGGFAFNRTNPNMTFGGKAFNMGGCMGCHGVAQQNGYAFSFVLLDGQGGALADTEAEENIPPTNLTYSLDVFLQSTLSNGMQLELDVGANNTVVINPQSSSGTQKWRLVPYYRQPSTANFPGQFIIQNTDTGDVLTAPQASGDPITLQKLISTVFPPGPLSQVWTLVAQGSPSKREFLILNTPSNLVLEVQNGGTAAGTPVVAGQAGPDANKGWKIVIPAP